MTALRPIRDDELEDVLAIVNAAAEAYRGVIPEDRWHDPYMSAAELDREIAAGVAFWGIEDDAGTLAGVMGIQAVRDVDLIRHAYVRPGGAPARPTPRPAVLGCPSRSAAGGPSPRA